MRTIKPTILGNFLFKISLIPVSINLMSIHSNFPTVVYSLAVFFSISSN